MADMQNHILAKMAPEKKLEAAMRLYYSARELKAENRGHFNIIHQATGFKADIYPIGSESLHNWAIANRRKVALSGDVVWLAPPEYVIVRKLQYYAEGESPKHLADIRSIFEISPNLINHHILMGFIEQYDLRKGYQQVTEDDSR
jgi:hypothetical protein